MLTLYTFGDSILDCGGYNAQGVTPGGLIVRNDDALFPEFRGHDLSARGEARLEERAVDGSTVAEVFDQLNGLNLVEPSLALLTIGGNDLLAGLAWDQGPGIERFQAALTEFVINLPIRPVFLGNVYDPTFGDDSRNFLSSDPKLGRANLIRINQAIAAVAALHGRLVDLHAHFLTGDPSWFTMIIEPSLRGASEVRRCFLAAIDQYLEKIVMHSMN